MKKNLFILSICVIASLASCKKESMPQEQDGVYQLVAALPEDAESKTTIGWKDSRYKLFWANGDKISAGLNNISAALTGITPETKSVTFTFSKAVSSGAFVRCPGVDTPTSVTIPAAQTSVDGMYDTNANPLWGKVTQTGTSVSSVQLNNAMAMLKFQVKGTAKIEKAVLTAVGGEAINGTFSMSTSGVISGGSGTGSENTITFDDPLMLDSETAIDVYIPVRPNTYSQGFKLTLYDKVGSYMTVTFLKGKTLTSANLAYFNIAYTPSRNPVEISALGVLGSQSASYEDDKPANGIRIGTYNVWSDGDRNNKIGSREDQYKYRTWEYTRDAVGALVAAMDCDIICFNEITANTCVASGDNSLQTVISKYTSDYTYSLRWPNVVDETWWGKKTYDYSYANGFAYKASNLTLSGSGKFWLNSGGSTSDDSDAGGKRTCVWMKFTQKSTGKTFYVAVAHLSITDQGSDDGAAAGEWNLKTAKYLIKYLKTRSGATDSSPIILCGDMNASNSTTNQGFKYIVNTYSSEPNTTLAFTDARDYLAAQGKLASSEKGLPGTSVGQWNMGQYIKSESHRYDHIMFRNATVSNFKSYKKTFTVDEDESGMLWYPSDHLPLSVDVVL